MSPTIDMPEPMQERVPAFVGSSVAGGCSTTECCCCAVLPTTSAAFATAFFSLSGALLLNMSTSVFRRHPLRKGPRLSWAIEHDLTQSFSLPAHERTFRLGQNYRIITAVHQTRREPPQKASATFFATAVNSSKSHCRLLPARQHGVEIIGSCGGQPWPWSAPDGAQKDERRYRLRSLCQSCERYCGISRSNSGK